MGAPAQTNTKRPHPVSSCEEAVNVLREVLRKLLLYETFWDNTVTWVEVEIDRKSKTYRISGTGVFFTANGPLHYSKTCGFVLYVKVTIEIYLFETGRDTQAVNLKVPGRRQTQRCRSPPFTRNRKRVAASLGSIKNPQSAGIEANYLPHDKRAAAEVKPTKTKNGDHKAQNGNSANRAVAARPILAIVIAIVIATETKAARFQGVAARRLATITRALTAGNHAQWEMAGFGLLRDVVVGVSMRV
ncbi:hypothetical protein EDD18DRAFT_1328698 [Armillaria luteobubalina]|uniref:Uncharacterized protein n=1 Tax=Armillaria luteobubalina TaxID=153913 RepID=A0AA39QH99_9AGAR|nr:hypothetical protein EDD18DRAFT_1328698 [Armillaria luteobubalina]